jgi:hypothetical protein
MTQPNADCSSATSLVLAPSSPEMELSSPFQSLPTHLLIDLAKNCMDIVQAILDLGVPREMAQLFAKEFPQQFGELIGERVSSKEPAPHWLEDTCILIQHIDDPDSAAMSEQNWGWQDAPPPLNSEQLRTALSHGAALQHSDKGFDLFQRVELSADQLHTLARCVDVLSLKGKSCE